MSGSCRAGVSLGWVVGDQMLWGLCQGQAGQPGGRSPTVPARSRAVRDSGHLPDDGARLMEPGCGPAGGGPCRAPWCPWQAQSWLWYRRGCGTGGNQEVEAWIKAAPEGRRCSCSTLWSPSRGSRRKGQSSLQAGPEHRQPSLQKGSDLRALPKVFLFGNKEHSVWLYQ